MKAPSFHHAILYAAARLVPRAQRAEWTAEWRAELWHVQRHPVRPNATSFCMGAFADAFWLWREASSEDAGSASLNSPAICLALLAAFGAICFAGALALPASRSVLLCGLYPRNLVMLSAVWYHDADIPNGFLDPYPSVTLAQFQSLKAQDKGRQFRAAAFYTGQPLALATSKGIQTLRVARTTAALWKTLNINPGLQTTTTPALILTSKAWRTYFEGGRTSPGSGAVSAVVPSDLWNLPLNVDGWLIDDEARFATLAPSTKGFAVARLAGHSFSSSRFYILRLPDRAFQLLWIVLPGFALACILFLLTSAGSAHLHVRGLRPLRVLFITGKAILLLPVILFGSLDLACLGNSVSGAFLDIAFLAGFFATRWLFADQKRRCPVCLCVLGNPVRIGDSSRILLEWHGRESMCPRGHGLLYDPEWPALWSGGQRWDDLGPSWSGLFP
jgi:hypothetical protein